MRRVFISYRRSDTIADAGRLSDHLVHRFGPDSVFMDLDDIHPGENFKSKIEKTVQAADAMLVLIGSDWLADEGNGRSRLHDPDDFVRMEIFLGLEGDIRVIPVLVGDARMPSETELPKDLASLALNQAFELSHKRYRADVEKLIEILERPPSERSGTVERLLSPVPESGRWGYIDREGSLVIEPQFDLAHIFQEGLGQVLVRGQWGFVDGAGRLVIEPRYDWVYPFKDGLAGVQLQGKHGFIDRKGHVVIDLQYDEPVTFQEGLALIRVRGRDGFIDRTGQWKIEPRFLEARFFNDGLAAVRLKREWGFIDGAGDVVIEPQFDTDGLFSEGLAAMPVEGQYGYLDRNGAWAIERQFALAFEFHDGLALAQAEVMGPYGFVDPVGDWQHEPQFEDAESFCQGIAAVSNGEKWGLLTRQDYFRDVEYSYDEISWPSEGMTAVKRGGKWGYVDEWGRETIPCTFEDAFPFQNGLARVQSKNEIAYLNRSGSIAWGPSGSLAEWRLEDPSD